MEPDPDAGIAVRVEVPLDGVANLPALAVGDRVAITAAAVQETEGQTGPFRQVDSSAVCK